MIKNKGIRIRVCEARLEVLGKLLIQPWCLPGRNGAPLCAVYYVRLKRNMSWHDSRPASHVMSFNRAAAGSGEKADSTLVQTS